MNLVVARYLNRRLIELRQDTKGEVVGVLLRSGRYRYVTRRGFIVRELGSVECRPASSVAFESDSAALMTP